MYSVTVDTDETNEYNSSVHFCPDDAWKMARALYYLLA